MDEKIKNQLAKATAFIASDVVYMCCGNKQAAVNLLRLTAELLNREIEHDLSLVQ